MLILYWLFLISICGVASSFFRPKDAGPIAKILAFVFLLTFVVLGIACIDCFVHHSGFIDSIKNVVFPGRDIGNLAVQSAPIGPGNFPELFIFLGLDPPYFFGDFV